MYAKGSTSVDPFVAAFGNPLLDLCVIINDSEILNKYGLQFDGQAEITEEELGIVDDIRVRYSPQYSAGGAAQNSLRVFQWLVREPFKSVYFGGIGTDDRGALLERLVKDAGVSTRYSYNPGYPTGTCIALINGEHRSLVAHIGAATKYDGSLLDSKDVTKLLECIKVLYIEGFFLTHSFPVCVRLIEICKVNKIPLIFNLSAPYVCESHTHEVTELVKGANIIFGNSAEFYSLAKQLNIKNSSLKDIVVKLRENFNNSLDESKLQHCDVSQILKEGKLIIATQGKNSVICVYGKTNTVLEVKVVEMDLSQVKDTTGAGDSFVAGVLAGIFHNCSLETCIHLGCWAAQEIIKQIGCTVPPYPPDGARKFLEG
ncbi:adenosine kinase-like isoform X1 [Schistocerca americana]|uniref:adenosine kinase-like isoform X1 n=1 Tax=Schistocerca americana TaxID=7009 RepID=UPI001F501C2E|nr:adenosine kinase-like isoform X1 [Schistocerca americana]